MSDLTNPFTQDEETTNEPLLDSEDGDHGEAQPRRIRDCPLHVLFYIHLILVFSVAVGYGLPPVANYDSEDSEDEDVEYSGLLAYSVIIALFSIGLAGVLSFVMQRFVVVLVKLCLLIALVASFTVTFASAATAQWGVFVVALIAFLLVFAYARAVWKRIPFATTTLKVAAAATKANRGVLPYSFLYCVVAIFWLFVWTFALIGLYNETSDCKVTDSDCDNRPDLFYLFLLLLSFYWTYNVLKNCVHVFTASIVGTWWSNPGESTALFSSTNKDAFFLASFYSFGSICFGSLILAFIQAVRAVVNLLRRDEEESGNACTSCLFCCIGCCISCIEGCFSFANKYAYVYVGLFGYSYIKAGRHAVSLFKSKGWSALINDALIDTVVFLVRLSTAGFCGVLGLRLESEHGHWFEAFGSDSEFMAFVLGCLLGYAMSGIALVVTEASVSTVIVLFALKPEDLSSTRPALHEELSNAYAKAYPDEFQKTSRK